MYQDQNHGISASGQSRHLYSSMTEFLLNDCWPQGATDKSFAQRGTSTNIMLLAGSLLAVLFWCRSSD